MTRPVARPAQLDPVAAEVETTLFRALAVLRFVVAAYAVVLNAVRWREFEHPVAGWAVVALIVAWTLVAAWAYDAPRRRRLPLLVTDLLVALLALLATPYVETAAMQARNAASLPSFWVIAAVLAWAVARGWAGGLATAVLVSAVDVSVRTSPTGTTWGNIFLLVLAAGVVGYSTGLIREATEARAEAERLAAALAERARLARVVHDGVLQVLALVQRKGAALGGEAGLLARLAGEQEIALRALVQGQADPPVLGGVAGPLDVVDELARLASRQVTVSGPGEPVALPAPVTRELVSVVRACLDNVARHVGDDAPAWVLVERVGPAVVVSVRDAGPGIAPGRLDQARREGRLGVSDSVLGRMAEIGGTARLVTAPGQGTEWELSVPAERRPGD